MALTSSEQYIERLESIKADIDRYAAQLARTDLSSVTRAKYEKSFGTRLKGLEDTFRGAKRYMSDEQLAPYMAIVEDQDTYLDEAKTRQEALDAQIALENSLTTTQVTPDAKPTISAGTIGVKSSKPKTSTIKAASTTSSASPSVAKEKPEPTIVRELPGGGYGIYGSKTGTLYDNKTYQTLPEALARQNVIMTGGAPTLAGRPDLLATAPGANQTVESFIDPETGQTITPRVATSPEMQAHGEGTLTSYDVMRGLRAAPAGTIGAPGTYGAGASTASGYGSSSSSSSSAAETTITSGLEFGVQQKEAEAKSENPALIVTPEMRAQWLQEAYDELRGNRFYQEVIRNAEFDLGTSINRLIADTRLREMATVQDYKENLRATQGDLQDRGMLYGGVRQGEERELADNTNLLLTGQEMNFLRGLQDTTKTGERYFGSDYAATLIPKFGTTQTVGRVIEGTPVFSAGSDTLAFTPLGGNYGSLPREIEEEARTRAGEKETAFRDVTSIYQ